MLFIAVGFFLVFWTPVLLVAGPYLAPLIGPSVYGMLGEISQIVGLLCILYGLRMPYLQRKTQPLRLIFEVELWTIRRWEVQNGGF
ncbi:hypothetical protein BRC72_10355 [Halobacteriales archaeon QH_7_66_36]|nr:MAG: hypothetical protein BRC72_10355 [Halobacteriales archaeon QH_7_66_36]